MSFKLPQIPQESKFSSHLDVEVVERFSPREGVSQLLTTCHAWQQRERKLSQLLIVSYVIALSLFRHLNVTEVFAHLSRGLRWLWPQESIRLPTGAALTAPRESLGIPVLRQLFPGCSRPLAPPKTTRAFALGMRLMALDGTLEDVAETQATASAFGAGEPRQESESLSPACAACPWPRGGPMPSSMLAGCTASEQALAPVLGRAIEKGLLVMTARHFRSLQWGLALKPRGAHVLARLAAGYFTEPSHRLPDGRSLVSVPPKGQKPLTWRIIASGLHPQLAQALPTLPSSPSARPAQPQAGHRLLTPLLDPVQAPALELIGLYEERWESELGVDEIQTPHRLSPEPLREPRLPNWSSRTSLLCCWRTLPCEPGCIRRLCKPTQDPDRLRFPHARQVLDTACFEFALVAPLDRPRFTDRLLADLREAKTLLPKRGLRFCPRVVKRAFSNFRRKPRWPLSFFLKGSSFRDILLL